MDETLDLIYTGTKCFSICGPVKIRKHSIYIQNVTVKQAFPLGKGENERKKWD